MYNVLQATMSARQIGRFGAHFAANANFKFTSRAWSQGKIGDSVGSLVDHFVRHGDKVGASSVSEYYQKANNFIDGQKAYVPGKNGDKQFFDPDTGMFAVTGRDNQIRTYENLSSRRGTKWFNDMSTAINNRK